MEGLEQTADETKAMATALRYITGANELGLSIDGGLGWLSGPDVNIRVLERDLKPAVFVNPNRIPEPKSTPRSPTRSTHNPPAIPQQNQRYHELERMCKAAGYRGEYLDAAVQLMLENEPKLPPSDEINEFGPASQGAFASRGGGRVGTVMGLPANANRWQPLNGQPTVYGQPQPNMNGMVVPTYSNLPGYNTNFAIPYGTGNLYPLPVNSGNANPLSNPVNTYGDPNDFYSSDPDDDDDESSVRRRDTEEYLNRRRERYSRFDANYLKPAHLTIAQKEMLLEIEWAQRAFMESYTIAVMDNTDAFKGINTLTIARLPYRHLPLLFRNDFWDSLQCLEKLSLAIIPDWRDIAMQSAGTVQEVPLRPSESLSGVYQLLQEYIADRENIKSLHFEWVGGGEYAAGMFSRNQHVMPAPVVSKAVDMVDRKQVQPVLRLPHLKHFSMKNCFVTPHMMREFVVGLKTDGIESITFNSVSLTANIPQGTNPVPLPEVNRMAHAGAFAPLQPPPPPAQPINQPANPLGVAQVNVATPAAALQTLVPISAVAAPVPNVPNLLGPPRYDSWTSIVDVLTPRLTIAQLRSARGFGYAPEPSSPTTIKKLDFTSCGYVQLPLDFNQSSLTFTIPTFVYGLAKRKGDIAAQMVNPFDPFLGNIVNFMPKREVDILQNVFALTVDWSTRGNDRDELIADCEADGFMDAGRGRFDGIITIDPAQQSV